MAEAFCAHITTEGTERVRARADKISDGSDEAKSIEKHDPLFIASLLDLMEK